MYIESMLYFLYHIYRLLTKPGRCLKLMLRSVGYMDNVCSRAVPAAVLAQISDQSAYFHPHLLLRRHKNYEKALKAPTENFYLQLLFSILSLGFCLGGVSDVLHHFCLGFRRVLQFPAQNRLGVDLVRISFRSKPISV